MSKKTRKKSSKAASKASLGKTPRAASATSSKTPAAKTRAAAAGKSGKKVTRQPGKITAKPSVKASPKQSKSPSPTVSARQTTARPKPAAKPASGNPTAGKPLSVKADAPAGRQSALAEGARAPAFHLPRDGGETVSLTDFAGRKLVLFFYPRADTPGCTKEAIDFTRLSGAFAESRTAILGVSADSLKAQEAFRDKHQLATPLVSDQQHEMLEAYGVWGEKSMYGKTFQGILRTTVLIGADGRVVKIWHHVKVDGHADEVLAAARTL